MSEKKISREAIRQATLGTTVAPQSKLITLKTGVEIEVRKISFVKAIEISKLTDQVEHVLHSIIESCYVPNTDIKVFEEADKEVLKKADHYVPDILNVINELAYIPDDVERKKN